MNAFVLDPSQAAALLGQQPPAPPQPPQPSDLELRLTALRFALTAEGGPQGDPVCILDDTRDFYLFLVGRDPVVDGIEDPASGNQPETLAEAVVEVDPEPTPVAEVISFREFLRNQRQPIAGERNGV